MSYAYIKSVYPDFQTNKVYDNKIYNSLDSINTSTQVSKENTIPAPFDALGVDEETRFARSLIGKAEGQELPSSTQKFKSIETLQNTPEKDNLRFYNIPYPFIQANKQVENFEEPLKQECKVDCNAHINHVVNCSKCRGIISRQLNIDNDRIRNEEFMELFSYIIFGIFILMLIDSLKKVD
jgi:hypothetical protein